MELVTYNQIIRFFKDFSTLHPQINTYYSGLLSEFEAQSNIYPSMITVPITSYIGKRDIRISFNIYFLDILSRSSMNLDEIHSDCLQYAQDLIKYTKDSFQNDYISFYFDENSISVEPLTEVLDDILGGWVLNVSVNYAYAGYCDFPFDTDTPIPPTIREYFETNYLYENYI